MDRPEAMALLRELISYNLVEPSWVSLGEIKPNKYQLQIKSDYNKSEIEEYSKEKHLTIIEDIVRKYLVIFKP